MSPQVDARFCVYPSSYLVRLNVSDPSIAGWLVVTCGLPREMEGNEVEQFGESDDSSKINKVKRARSTRQ